MYVDGKGDNCLFAKVFSMCRTMGREDDLLLINFMTGARDIVGRTRKTFIKYNESILQWFIQHVVAIGRQINGFGSQSLMAICGKAALSYSLKH